jgi:hypothetical protein
MASPATVNRRRLLSVLGGSIAAPLLALRIARSQEAWPARTVRSEIRAFRDAEEARLLPILKAAGIKPE